MLTLQEMIVKHKLKKELKRLGAIKEDYELISKEMIKNIIKSGKNVEDVAWAMMQ